MQCPAEYETWFFKEYNTADPARASIWHFVKCYKQK